MVTIIKSKLMLTFTRQLTCGVVFCFSCKTRWEHSINVPGPIWISRVTSQDESSPQKCNSQPRQLVLTHPAPLCRRHTVSPNTCHSQNSTPGSLHLSHRSYSTSYQEKLTDKHSADPFLLASAEMSSLTQAICQEMSTEECKLRDMSQYYFNLRGKNFRPLVAILMAKACNSHSQAGDCVTKSQKDVAMVTEMYHTASLIHDDVIDASDTRRGQLSLNKLHGQRLSILSGDFIIAHASMILARTNNTQVISLMSSVMEDLVSGEFMQLGSKEDINERFSHYLIKTYKKTASLIANACKSVAVLSGVNEEMQELAFQYGRNLGIAFQLIDDLLDFVSCESVLGKPTDTDLKLGLATAPVLFAAQEYPELHPMIMRRFSEGGDVEQARLLVAKSNGVEQTRLLASQHSKAAVTSIQQLSPSQAQQVLIGLTTLLLDRKK